MKTQQNSHKLNNQPGYPFISITVDKNDIGLSIHSFTGSVLGSMSIEAYSPCFQDDISLILKDERLIVQVGVDYAINQPYKMHLLDMETRYMLRTGLFASKTAEIKFNKSFVYRINNYRLISRNILLINLSYQPDYFKIQNKTA